MLLRRWYYIDPPTHSAYFLRGGRLWIAQPNWKGKLAPYRHDDFTMPVPLWGESADLCRRDRKILRMLLLRTLNPLAWIGATWALARNVGFAKLPPFFDGDVPPVERSALRRGWSFSHRAPQCLIRS